MLQDSSYLFAINSLLQEIGERQPLVSQLEVIHHKLPVVLRISKSNWCSGQVWIFWRRLVLTKDQKILGGILQIPHTQCQTWHKVSILIRQRDYWSNGKKAQRWCGRTSRFCSNSIVFVINLSLLYVSYSLISAFLSQFHICDYFSSSQPAFDLFNWH